MFARSVLLGLLLGMTGCTAPAIDGESRYWREAGYRIFEYAERPQAGLDMYLRHPEGDGPFATVLLFHGGGWAGGSARDMRAVGDALVDQGFAVVIPAYRVHGRDLTLPTDAVADAVSAYAYLGDHAETLNIDPTRIALWGRSVGAHLAFWVLRSEAAQQRPPWRAVFVSGVMDTSVDGYHPPLIERLADPLSPADAIVAEMPPLFVLHGAVDAFNNASTVERFVARWRGAGNVATVRIVDGLRHGFYFHYDGSSTIMLDGVGAYPDVAIEFLAETDMDSP